MKKSLFNIIIPSEEDDTYIIYNSRTQAFAVIDQKIVSKLDKSENGNVYDLSIEEKRDLIENGFCINDDENEKEIIDNWLYSYSVNSTSMNITLLTTFLCNFSCNYCFEKNKVHKIIDMSYNTAEKIVKWIEKKVETRNIKVLNVFFYGGEPLLNKDIIYHISKKLNRFSIRQNLKFIFGIVTNGFLINKEDNEKLKSIGLDFYRITIDGSEKWHDKERFLKGNLPTFQKIIKNISENTDGVKVIISGNYKKETVSGIFELIDFLKGHSIKDKIHSISFSPIMNINLNSCSLSTCQSPKKENLIDIELEIEKKIEESGFKNSRSLIGMISCPFKIKDMNITITPDGNIYKCPATIGYNEYIVGHIANNELNRRNEEIFSKKITTKCYPCVYLPMCAGGCYLEALMEKNDFFGISCPKDRLDKTIEYALRLKYKKYKESLNNN